MFLKLSSKFIMRFHEGLIRVHLQKTPRLHFGESFALREMIS